jgi:hypothetical protein
LVHGRARFPEKIRAIHRIKNKTLSASAIPPMNQRGQNGIQDVIELFAFVIGQEIYL